MIKDIKQAEFALNEVVTHLESLKHIIQYAIDVKPENCIKINNHLTLCSHCEADLSWLKHEMKALESYSKEIKLALGLN